MKLKAIMYALGYGKSRKALVRGEGTRRVKQAEKLSQGRGATLSEQSNTVLTMSKQRSQGRTQTFINIFGSKQL
jgi:hypothetical protein